MTTMIGDIVLWHPTASPGDSYPALVTYDYGDGTVDVYIMPGRATPYCPNGPIGTAPIEDRPDDGFYSVKA